LKIRNGDIDLDENGEGYCEITKDLLV